MRLKIERADPNFKHQCSCFIDPDWWSWKWRQGCWVCWQWGRARGGRWRVNTTVIIVDTMKRFFTSGLSLLVCIGSGGFWVCWQQERAKGSRWRVKTTVIIVDTIKSFFTSGLSLLLRIRNLIHECTYSYINWLAESCAATRYGFNLHTEVIDDIDHTGHQVAAIWIKQNQRLHTRRRLFHVWFENQTNPKVAWRVHPSKEQSWHA